MFSETIYFYFLSVMLLGSACMVIFAPRMFLALIGLFFAFLFSGMLCMTLNATFVAIFLFVLGCLILCPIIFLLMKRINRWNLQLKLAQPLKIIVSSVAAIVFGLIACLFVKEEFSNSLFNIFNFTNEKSADILNFKDYIFPLHIIIILVLISILAIRAILTSTNSTGENDD